jgi:hypothetical protein
MRDKKDGSKPIGRAVWISEAHRHQSIVRKVRPLFAGALKRLKEGADAEGLLLEVLDELSEWAVEEAELAAACEDFAKHTRKGAPPRRPIYVNNALEALGVERALVRPRRVPASPTGQLSGAELLALVDRRAPGMTEIDAIRAHVKHVRRSLGKRSEGSEAETQAQTLARRVRAIRSGG